MKIDRATCIGCSLCESICPEVFEMDDENIAVVIVQPDDSNEDKAQDALEACPVGAIKAN